MISQSAILAALVGAYYGKPYGTWVTRDTISYIFFKYSAAGGSLKTRAPAPKKQFLPSESVKIFFQRRSSEAKTTLSMTGDSKDILLSEIQPGIKKPMSTAFEIPLAAAREGVKLIIPEKGIFGTKSVEIVLPMVK